MSLWNFVSGDVLLLTIITAPENLDSGQGYGGGKEHVVSKEVSLHIHKGAPTTSKVSPVRKLVMDIGIGGKGGVKRKLWGNEYETKPTLSSTVCNVIS